MLFSVQVMLSELATIKEAKTFSPPWGNIWFLVEVLIEKIIWPLGEGGHLEGLHRFVNWARFANLLACLCH